MFFSAKSIQSRYIKVLITLAIVVIIVVSGILPRLVDTQTQWLVPQAGSWGWLGLLLNFGLVLYIWVFGIRQGLDLLEPIYLISVVCLLVFVLRPLQIMSQFDSRVAWMPNKPELIQQALLLGALGNASLIIGYRSKLGPKLSQRYPHLSPRWRAGRLLLISVVYVSISIAGFAYAVDRSGGLESFLETLQGRSLLSDSNSQIFAALSVLSYVVTAMLASYYALTKRFGIFFILSLALSTGMGLIQGGRAVVLVIWITVFVVFYYLRRSRRVVTLRVFLITLGFLLAVVIFIVVLGTKRTNIQLGVDTLGQSEVDMLQTDDLTSGFMREFSQFDWFVIVLDISPSIIPYQYGSTFMDFFAQFVPRLVWRDKPLPIEYVVTQRVTGVESGSPFTIIGELYLNFLWPGVVMGMLLFGVLMRSVYDYLQRNPRNLSVIIIFGYIYANLLQLYTRSFAPMMFFIVIFLVPAGFALLFVRDKSVLSETAVQ